MTRYEVLSQIGRGSCSRVFIAKRLDDAGETSAGASGTGNNGDNDEDSIVVLKERDYTDNAIKEASLLKSLKPHPCIIRFEDAFLINDIDKICIVMEPAKRDLKQILESYAKKAEKVPVQLAQRWICQISLGLAYLHSRAIVHRDIKPANLLLLSDGRMVLGDLGTAKANVFEEEFGSQTMLGTPFYLAPEVLQGQNYGTKADMWSLGCVAFEMATSGRYRAFQASSIEELTRNVSRGSVQWSRLALGTDFVDQIIRPCLRTVPTMRAGIEDILRSPSTVRAIGGFVADLRQGRLALPRNRAECLLVQLADLGLRNTVVAGMKLGAQRKRQQYLSSSNVASDESTTLEETSDDDIVDGEEEVIHQDYQVHGDVADDA